MIKTIFLKKWFIIKLLFYKNQKREDDRLHSDKKYIEADL